ncbi:TonB-dependent receptor [Mucilaginibacter oryzae]|uniref:TonB-dependent receptor n=1 Tax=Mucilaginibacter oryzae TaxID=468058 RepID=A0A316HEJ1_9SPHI|nr:TonB-dependent receptor [Mucilaginibacter oryzae]PWK79604.1 TonB-dependent receptor [Mucilaginibacter oryzae]
MYVFTNNNFVKQKKSTFIVLIIVLFTFYSIAAANAQLNITQLRNPVSLAMPNTNLDEVLVQLKKQSTYDFFYDKEAAKKVKVNNINYSNTALGNVLTDLKKSQALEYELQGKEISVRIEKRPAHAPARQQKDGKITGKILDDKGETLPGATIKLVETGKAIQSAPDGSYQFVVAPGTYTIEITYISFQSQRITGIVVNADKSTLLDIAMKPASNALSEVVVKSDYKRASIQGLYARQKNNAALSDGITAEQISRTPDNNTAQVLTRVSGLQVSQNRFVVVRGMSDRYNNVMLNGAPLPSSEPNRRDFAFDVIPSSLVDNIVVNKTATPDLTGEFTGGLVQITTKDIPDENYIQLTVGGGYNSRATGKDFISGHRGTANYFGFANDYQRRPTGMTMGEYNNLGIQIAGNNATPDQKAQAAKFLGTLPDNWALRKYTAHPIQSYQFTVAQSFPFKDNSTLGLVAALTYRNEQLNQQHDVSQLTVSDYKGTDYIFNTLWGGSLNLGYTSGRNKFSLKNTYNRRFNDEYFTYSGTNISDNRFTNSYSNQTIINQLFQTNFTGEHTLGKRGVKADYGFALSTVNRDQPFTRLMESGRPLQSANPDDYYSYNFGDANINYGNIFYSKLAEKRYTWQTNLQFPFRMQGLNQSLKIGYQGSYRRADFGADFYRIKNVSTNTTDSRYDGQAYYDVYNSTQFANGSLYLYPTVAAGNGVTNPGAGTGYKGRQNLNAFYGMVDLKPLKNLRIIGGVRYERNEQNVFTTTRGKAASNQVAPMVDSLIQSKNNDWLPSFNAIYALNSKMNIRAAYYKTVARPDFRELSFFTYFDYDLFLSVSGDNLKRTSIQNYDLRYEFYPSPGEILSVSGFYKKFTDPIEILYPNANPRRYIYSNLKGAKNTGIEVDFRKSLNFISGSSPLWANLYISGNFTYLDANVDLGTVYSVNAAGKAVPSKRNRPLTGQSPYIINTGILYTGKHFGFNATYNRFGHRIVYASPDRSEDMYENGRNVIDMQLSYKFLKDNKAEFRLNISNLLNSQMFYYRNQYGPGNKTYPEQTPSVESYPGDGTPPPPSGQLDPKGTKFNAAYDTKMYTWKYGTTSTLNFIYRF